jgi:hypothetical protein
MKQISILHSSLMAIVDDDDYDRLLAISPVWSVDDTKHVNTRSGLSGERVYMHRIILRLPKHEDGEDVDHVNQNPLDNRKENLRVCKHYQNLHNVTKLELDFLTSKYKGVSWHKKGRKWQVHLSVAGKRFYGGLFVDEKDAARKANQLMSELVGEFACLNIIE